MPTYGAELELLLPEKRQERPADRPPGPIPLGNRASRPEPDPDPSLPPFAPYGFSMSREDSLSSRPSRNREARTEPCQSAEALVARVRKMMEVLVWDFPGIHPGRKCGFHIHCQADGWRTLGIRERYARSLAALYHHFIPAQDALFKLAYAPQMWEHPRLRERIQYCQKLFDGDILLYLLPAACKEGATENRYHSCNPFPRPGTTWELRLWPATLDPEEAATYIRATAALFESIPWQEPLLIGEKYLEFRRTIYEWSYRTHTPQKPPSHWDDDWHSSALR